MLGRSETPDEDRTEIDINKALEECTQQASDASELKGSGITTSIVYELDDGHPTCVVRKNDLNDALMNVLNNAFHSMYLMHNRESSGTYIPELRVSSLKKDGVVEIVISDNGIGIPENNIDKVFDPFFTTKKGKEGSGLGLSATYEIITQRHNGDIRIESIEGEYCRIIINLPIH
jgi:signal transduction histidine kinase